MTRRRGQSATKKSPTTEEVEAECVEKIARKVAPRKKGRQPKKRARTDSNDDNIDEMDGYSYMLDEVDKSTLMAVDRHDFDALLTSSKYDNENTRLLYKRMEPEELNFKYYETTGLECPLLFRCSPDKLGMTMPAELTVDKIAELVNPNRLIDVVKVREQKSETMSMAQWAKYYNLPAEEKKELYNVLSLEFSHTPLADLVKSPQFVRNIDWTEKLWPDANKGRRFSFRKDGCFHVETNFPKISYYCLMSPNKSYTDFHIDFGGTSVWYHVLRGKKTFFIVEPTEENIAMYEMYMRHPDQAGFYGDVADRCARIELHQGDTLIIPSGWLHAVFTPADSLVFGGNFLHTLNAAMQLRILLSENRIKIGSKYTFPFMEELMQYVIADYVEKATGRKYVRPLKSPRFGYDYCGTKWLKHGGHLQPIDQADFPEISTVVNEDDSKEDEEGTVRVFAMHSGSHAAPYNIIPEFGLEEEFDDITPQPSVFYDAELQKLEGEPRHGKSAVHKLSIDAEAEGKLEYDENFLSTITPLAVSSLSSLIDYFKKRPRITVADGITRPASLLNCFQRVLAYRRVCLEREGHVIADSTTNFVPRPKAEISEELSADKAADSSQGSMSNKVEEDETFENEDEEPEGDYKPAPKKRGRPKRARTNSITEPIARRITRSRTKDPFLTMEFTLPDNFDVNSETKISVSSPVDQNEKTEEQIEEISQNSTIDEIKSETELIVNPQIEEQVTAVLPPKDTSHDDNIDQNEVEVDLKSKPAQEEKVAISEDVPSRLRKRKSKSMVEVSDREDEDIVESDHPTPESAEIADKKKKKSLKEETHIDEYTPKSEKEKKRKNKQLDRERDREKMLRKRPMSFADALSATTSKPKHKKKDEIKPLFVDGMPVLASKELQEKRNTLYDFNPLESITALGTAPIQSAYRMSKKLKLITPNFNTKKYKVETSKDFLIERLEQNEEKDHENGQATFTLTQVSKEPSTSTTSPASKLHSRVQLGSSLQRQGSASSASQFTPPPTSVARRTSFDSSQPNNPPRRPSYVPATKPLLSPFETPQAQRTATSTPMRPPLNKKEPKKSMEMFEEQGFLSEADIQLAHIIEVTEKIARLTRELNRLDNLI